jgi:hypothetical protein
MRHWFNEETILGLVALALAGVAPNIFPAAMAGFGTMPILAARFLLPAAAAVALVAGFAAARGHHHLVNRILAGAAGGAIATLGLEVVRLTSFHLGGMPGDLPRLMGVLLTDRFMLGPSLLSDVLGWTYHFWNGACFGIIFTVLLGQRRIRWAITYGVLIGLGFLLSPVVKSLGIGFMGFDMPTMPATVLLAHAVFGWMLGFFSFRWIRHRGGLFSFRQSVASDTISSQAVRPKIEG